MSSSKELRVLLRKIIKEEVRDLVLQEVNAILAEKFVMSTNNRQNLTETVAQKVTAPRREVTPEKKQLRESFLKKMGADENPMMGLIYGDNDICEPKQDIVLSNGVIAPTSRPTQLPNGMIVDSDDEGIDISQFMRK